MDKHLCKIFFVFFLIGMFCNTSEAFAKDWKVKDFSPGRCFSITLQGKRDCSGDVTVIFYSRGEGYVLHDRYSALKGKTHSISGCYDPSRAKLAGRELFQWGVINDPTGNHGYIFIDREKVKHWKW